MKVLDDCYLSRPLVKGFVEHLTFAQFIWTSTLCVTLTMIRPSHKTDEQSVRSVPSLSRHEHHIDCLIAKTLCTE